MIRNVHERELDISPTEAGALLDSLAGRNDRLWPRGRWPAMRFDRELGVGANGGHGPIRYSVSDYEPGRRVVFRFAGTRFPGHHWFEVFTRDGRTVLRHVLEVRTRGRMRLAWPLVYRWLHDALIEDLLDRAADTPERQLPRAVRLLRAWLRRRVSAAGA